MKEKLMLLVSTMMSLLEPMMIITVGGIVVSSSDCVISADFHDVGCLKNSLGIIRLQCLSRIT